MKNFLRLLTIIFTLFGFVGVSSAAEKIEYLKTDWSFKGLFGKFDRGSLQRGYQVYAEVCSSCHSMKYLSYRNLSEKGGPEFTVAMHMKNPLIPAMHFNTRYICTKQEWFGGGMDVTPSKKDKNEKLEIHKILKEMCNRHNKNYYSKYKKWCDRYFYLPHRKEMRGIGGIFFDYKKNNFEKDFKFVRDVDITFQFIFNNIIKKKINKKMDYTR